VRTTVRAIRARCAARNREKNTALLDGCEDRISPGSAASFVKSRADRKINASRSAWPAPAAEKRLRRVCHRRKLISTNYGRNLTASSSVTRARPSRARSEPLTSVLFSWRGRVIWQIRSEGSISDIRESEVPRITARPEVALRGISVFDTSWTAFLPINRELRAESSVTAFHSLSLSRLRRISSGHFGTLGEPLTE